MRRGRLAPFCGGLGTHKTRKRCAHLSHPRASRTYLQQVGKQPTCKGPSIPFLFKNGEAARRTPVHRSACHVEGKRIPAVGPLLLDNCTPAIWFSFRTSSRHRPAAGDTSQRHTNHATTTETPSCASPAQRGRLGRVLGAPRLCSPCTKCASAQPPSPLPKASMTHLRQDGQQGRPSRRFVLKGAVRG